MHAYSPVHLVFGFVVLVILIVFAYSAASFAQSYSRSIDPSAVRSFTVSAEGDVTAVPDIAQFTFRVITEGGTDLGRLQQENTERTNRAIDFVKGQGIEERDITTRGYAIHPRQQHFSCPSPREEGRPCPPPEIVGYMVTQTVEVKVREFERVGGLLSGVVENGANSVSQLVFTIDDPSALQEEARNEAIQKAHQKAESMAQAAGVRLGGLLSMQEGSPSIPSSFRLPMAEAMPDVAEPAPAPFIEPGEQEVKVNVTLTYEIR